jgi:hypothetical protein
MYDIQRLLHKHPNKIPIVLDVEGDLDLLSQITYKKYLINKTATFGEFQCAVRSKCNIPSEKALCFFVNRTELCPVSELVSTLYARHVPNSDAVLPITVCTESVFGDSDRCP